MLQDNTNGFNNHFDSVLVRILVLFGDTVFFRIAQAFIRKHTKKARKEASGYDRPDTVTNPNAPRFVSIITRELS